MFKMLLLFPLLADRVYLHISKNLSFFNLEY